MDIIETIRPYKFTEDHQCGNTTHYSKDASSGDRLWLMITNLNNRSFEVSINLYLKNIRIPICNRFIVGNEYELRFVITASSLVRRLIIHESL